MKPSREQMLTACDMAARLFQSLLTQDEAASDYAKKDRRLSNETILKLGIGYAANSWSTLTDSLPEELLDAGVEAKVISESKAGRRYDFFRDRLVFPISDSEGRVIGFGGRVLSSDTDGPKYLNSPSTPLFDKGSVLYNLNNAKAFPENIIVAEGYMDVAAGEENRIRNMVGTLGVAFTSNHAKLLSEHNIKRVTFCFDGDSAGRSAALRTLDVCPELLERNITPYFCFMPGGKDPDDVLKEDGRDAFVNQIHAALPVQRFIAREVIKRIKEQNPSSIDISLKHASWGISHCKAMSISSSPFVDEVTRDTGIDYFARKSLLHYSKSTQTVEKGTKSEQHKTPSPP